MLDKIQIMDHLALRWGHNLPILPASLFEQCNNLQLLLFRPVLRGCHSVILSKTFVGLSGWALGQKIEQFQHLALGFPIQIEELAVRRQRNLCFAAPTFPLQQLHFLTI